MTTTTATVQTPAGETWNLGETATTWKFASFYTATDTAPGRFSIKYHRSEAAAAKGQWDSPYLRTVLTYAGYAPIVRP
jgi:hypothetical protein